MTRQQHSGSGVNLINQASAFQLNLLLPTLPQLLHISTRTITQCTTHSQLRISSLHHKYITLSFCAYPGCKSITHRFLGRIHSDTVWPLFRPLCVPAFDQRHAERYARKFVFTSINNILIYSPSLESDVDDIKRVLSRLLQSQLCVRGEKCKFYIPTISFLGYIVNQEGIIIDDIKVNTVYIQYRLTT